MTTLAVGTKLGRYEIRSKIGEGGMGEVYRARDEKLNRDVAIKVLPASLSQDEDRLRRFEQEAQAAGALNHPNILAVYDVGVHDGAPYIVSELLEGEELREQLNDSLLPQRKALDYAQQIAQGLAAAHERGITHRDLKPENLFITIDGRVKILDFGLAKLRPQRGEPVSSEIDTRKQITDPGTVMGTVGYMSPEQAQGKTKEIDQRSDIFSFGCILFEAVTGKKPFEGDSVVKSLHMVIYESAPPLADLNPTAPPELQRIVRRCLEKDADDRYQSIREVAIELKHLRRELETGADFDTTVPPPVGTQSALSTNSGSKVEPTAAAPASIAPSLSSAEYVVQGIKRHKLLAAIALMLLIGIGAVGVVFLRGRNAEGAIESIAVLPFENKSNAANTDYLSDGLAESLIYRLSQLPNLKVSPTSSVMRYKGKETDVKKIASELGVNAVMTGRIAQRGDNLTISVELVDARNNKLLWGEQYERKMSELLATQREIAAEIANKLQLKLLGGEKGLTKRYTNNNEAYQLYLKGRYHLAKRTKDDMLKGIDYFQQAIKLDPKFALAYAMIADSYAVMPAYPYLSPKEASPQAKAAAQRALEIDPTLAEAHMALAYSLTTYDWNWLEAEREFKRALELDPNSSVTHFRYGLVYLAAQGRFDEAIAELKRSVELEPLALINQANLAGVYVFAGQSKQGLEQARKTYELEPNFVTGRYALGLAYDANGMYTEAITLGEKSLQTDPTSQLILVVTGYAYAKSGRKAEAENVINRFREIAKTQYVMSYYVGCIYAALGDKDKAFAEPEKAFVERDWDLHRLKIDPFLEPLRDDPRFADLVKRVGLP